MFRLNNPTRYLIFIRIAFWIVLIMNFLIMFFENEEYYYIVPIISLIAIVSLGIGYSELSMSKLFICAVTLALYRIYQIQRITEIEIFPIVLLLLSIIHIFLYILLIVICKFTLGELIYLKQDNLDITLSLTNALLSRDKYTKNHSENVANYAVIIAKEMNLPSNVCESIYIGGLLHDIGKIGIPENILLKPGKLTNEEFAEIKKHPQIGYEMIKHIESFKKNGVLDIVLYHHERFDGKGYPYGIKGEEIPLLARITAVADSFDAMNSKRNYRDKLDTKYIYKELENNKGIQFDAKIVDIFLNVLRSYDSPEDLIKNYKKE